MPRRRRNPESSIGKTILESSARTVYVLSYADRVEDLGLEGAGAGQDWFDVAPAGWSLAAQQWAEEMWTAIVAQNPLAMPPGAELTESVEECFREACARDFDEELAESNDGATDFGHYIAMQVLGHGVSWMDDHEDHGLKIPYRESDAWGIVPDADLAPLVSTEMLAEAITENVGPEDDEQDVAMQMFDEMEVALADYDNISNVASLTEYIRALDRLYTHLNYASGYQNAELERARDICALLEAGAARELYLMQHPDERGGPRKNPRALRMNPTIERKKRYADGRLGDSTTDYYGVDAEPVPLPTGGVGLRPTVLAYDFVVSRLRIVRRDEGERTDIPGVFIVAKSVDTGTTHARTEQVELTIYLVNPERLGLHPPPNSASLEERSEWAKENADVIFRDQLDVNMEGATEETSVEMALFPLRRDLNILWPAEVDGKLTEVREALGGRRIRTTYDVVTPESAAEGDYADAGWVDEYGESMEPDEYDIEEAVEKLGGEPSVGAGALWKTTKWLRERGPLETSSTQFHAGVWYMQSEGHIDHSTGAETRESYHLVNYTESEQRAIFTAISFRIDERFRRNPAPRTAPKTNPHPLDFEACKECGRSFIEKSGKMRWRKTDVIPWDLDPSICMDCGVQNAEHRRGVREFEETMRATERRDVDDLKRKLNPAHPARTLRTNAQIPKYEEGAYGGGFPKWKGAQSRGHVGVQKGIDWDQQPLGEVADAELARRLGVSYSVVRRAREDRRIPKKKNPSR